MLPGPSRLWQVLGLAAAAVLFGDLLASQIVRAASETGAKALEQEAGAACQIASELEQSRVVWSSPDYQHNAALIVTGKWPPTIKKGEQAYMLCLFDKQNAKVELQEIDGKLFR